MPQSHSHLREIGLLLFGVAVTMVTSSDGDLCALRTPDPTKTCISIRLPWNPQPLYFCTDKSSFKYRNQCRNQPFASCGSRSIRNDSLLIALPWECCPISSDPDNCVHQQCPSPPLNRDCQATEPDLKKPDDCCPTYFCEGGNLTQEMCHFRRLEPSCNNPPAGKDPNTCVAFVDPFGCCPKFQCEGEGATTTIKQGQCPAQRKAQKLMDRYQSGNFTAVPPPPPQAGIAPQSESAFAMKSQYQTQGYGQNSIPCVGDFNCPGKLKCCSSDSSVYLQDGRYTFRNRNPTNGYCTEPVDPNKKDDKESDFTY